MEPIVNRVTALRLVIEEMLARTGTAGLTYGIIYQGEVVHTEHFGYRDIDKKLPVNGDTIFPIASLTKNMVSAIVGMLVEEGKLSWNTPIKDILTDWNVHDSTVYNLTTIVECLGHRTGLQMNNYWLASNNNIIIPLKDSMKLINGLKPVKPFRGQFQYNNLGYEVASHVIRKLSGQSWNQMLQSRLFDPLEMTRTGTHQNFAGFGNVSKAYGALSNRSPVRISDPQIGDNTLAGANGGVRSTLHDMLKLTQAWLHAAEHQFNEHVTSTPDSPLKQVGHIMSGHIPISSHSYRETSYAQGFARTQLPGTLGAIGLNGFWLSEPAGAQKGFPLVGKGANPQLVVYHQGSNPGVLAAYNLLPESQSAVVVLSNTLALVDTADWVGQLLLEAVLNVPNKNDYLQITKETTERALAWYGSMHKELRENRTHKAPRNLKHYVGVYWNVVGTVHIDVAVIDGIFSIIFQGLPDEVWPLHHWEQDTFTWLPDSRDAIASRGRFTFQSPDYYKIKFGLSDGDKVESLIWIHEGWNVPEGEVFFKTDRQKTE